MIYSPPPRREMLRLPRQVPKRTVPSYIGEPGQVLNMLMNYTKGDTHVHDHSPYGNHGVMHNFTPPDGWVDGSYGWALDFDGSDDTVEIPDDPSLDITGEITVEMWVHPDTPSENEGYCSKGLPGGSTPYQLADDAEGPLFRIKDSGGTQYQARRGAAHLSVGWHHMVGVYDLSDLILYLEGTKAVTNSIGDVTPLATNDLSFYIGGYYSTDYLDDGTIKLVRIYDRALADTEVSDRFESTRGIFGV